MHRRCREISGQAGNYHVGSSRTWVQVNFDAHGATAQEHLAGVAAPARGVPLSCIPAWTGAGLCRARPQERLTCCAARSPAKPRARLPAHIRPGRGQWRRPGPGRLCSHEVTEFPRRGRPAQVAVTGR